MANWKGTIVPNSGYVEKVYLNTNLNHNEVQAIIQKAGLDFSALGTASAYDWIIVAYGNTSNTTTDTAHIIFVRNCYDETYNMQYYTIELLVGDIVNGTTTVIFNGSPIFKEEVGFLGWNPDIDFSELDINSELATEEELGVSFGTKNALLSSLFSITPFEEVDITPVSDKKGTLLVSNEYTFVEKIYFNTDLSIDNVKEILGKLFYCPNGFLYVPFMFSTGEGGLMLVGNYTTGDFGILAVTSSGEYPIFTTSVEAAADFGITVDWTGWNPELTNPLEINDYGISDLGGITAGDQNYLLTNLLSMNEDFELPIITNLPEFLTGIADAIREVKGTTEKINAQNFRPEIRSIVPNPVVVEQLPSKGKEEAFYKLNEYGLMIFENGGLADLPDLIDFPVKIVDNLPAVGETNTFYYSTSEEQAYIYGGEGVWNNLAEAFNSAFEVSLNFMGLVEDPQSISEDGYYISIKNIKFYRYKNNEFIEFDKAEYKDLFISMLSGKSEETTLVIPKTVTNLRAGAFAECTFENIMLEGDSIDWYGVSTDCIFYECNNLKNIDQNIIKGISYVGYKMFYNCDNLTSLELNQGYTVEDYGFFGCGNLQNITFNGYSNWGKIGKQAFYACSNLKSIKLPSCCVEIHEMAFTDSGLESIVIPKSVLRIHDSAFVRCDSLTNVYFTGTEEEWNAITIGENNSDLISATITYNYVEE